MIVLEEFSISGLNLPTRDVGVSYGGIAVLGPYRVRY